MTELRRLTAPLEELAADEGLEIVRLRYSPWERRYCLVRPALGIRRAVETAEVFYSLRALTARLRDIPYDPPRCEAA